MLQAIDRMAALIGIQPIQQIHHQHIATGLNLLPDLLLVTAGLIKQRPDLGNPLAHPAPHLCGSGAGKGGGNDLAGVVVLLDNQAHHQAR